jgi:hypothetical protein
MVTRLFLFSKPNENENKNFTFVSIALYDIAKGFCYRVMGRRKISVLHD